jgi:crotonobetaine/carnitine-CoA ligase
MLNEEDVIYNDLPMYHVGGAFANVAKAVFAGCQAAVWDKFSVSQFWDRIRESGATNAILLDVMIPWLMKAGEKASDRRNTLNNVYMQPLPQYHHQVARRFGFDFVLAGFGQTESGHGFSAVIEECGPGEGTPADLYRGYPREVLLDICRQHGVPVVDGRRELKKGFMGKPSKFMEAAILNEQDEECPPGQVGEIAFRPRLPHLLMREYFRKPEETVRAFRNLWFHTGDAGYRDEDGNFFFVDRLGSVVRHRGEKFSSYQVEDLLLQHPAVEMCAAFPVPAEEGDEDDLAAYLVLKEGAALTEDELRGWMASHMPKFMQPRYVRFVKDIPRTPTNKVEKYKLRNQLLEEISAGEGGRKRS